MLAYAIKDIPPVHGLVIVQEHHIAGLHLDIFHFLRRDAIQTRQLFLGQGRIVAKIHVRLVDAAGPVFKALGAVTAAKKGKEWGC